MWESDTTQDGSKRVWRLRVNDGDRCQQKKKKRDVVVGGVAEAVAGDIVDGRWLTEQE